METEAKRKMLRHFLAALAYRTQKALRGAPEDFGSFSIGEGVRTPAELLRHMTSVLGYSRTFFIGGTYRPEPLPSLGDEIVRFHELIEDIARLIETGEPFREGVTPERMLQGPFSDAMTHAGQLALLRRLATRFRPRISSLRTRRRAPRSRPDAARQPRRILARSPAGTKSGLM